MLYTTTPVYYFYIVSMILLFDMQWQPLIVNAQYKEFHNDIVTLRRPTRLTTTNAVEVNRRE